MTETELVDTYMCTSCEQAWNSVKVMKTCRTCGRKIDKVGWFEQSKDTKQHNKTNTPGGSKDE